MVMDKFVNDYLSTFNADKRQRASIILDTLKFEKNNLGAVVAKLNSFGVLPTINISDELPNMPVSSGKNTLAFRDIAQRTKILYQESNLISVLLDSFGSSLLSDIGSLNDEISALEKALSNYGFLLSDGGAFDYAYLESFSDERNRDSFDFELSDRASLVFSQSQEAVVNTQEGTLGISNKVETGYPIHGVIVASNSEGQGTDTGINNAANGDLTKGWKVSMQTTRALQNTLSYFKGLYGRDSWIGAQYVVEFVLDKPSPVDVVRISPFTDFPFELTQLELFSSHNNANSKKILAEPIKLEKLISVEFPLQTIQRVRMYLRQETFLNAGIMTIWPPEQETRPILNGYNNLYMPPPPPPPKPEPLPQPPLFKVILLKEEQRPLPPPRSNFSTKDDWMNYLAQMKQFWQYQRDDQTRRETLWFDALSLSKNMSMADFNKMFVFSDATTEKTLRVLENFMTQLQNWPGRQYGRSDKAYPFILSKLANNLASYVDIFNNPPVPVTPVPPVPPPMPIPGPISAPITYKELQPTIYQLKKYNLGLQFVKIGIGAKGNKGVFVTKPFPAPGDMGEVKIKVGESNYSHQGTSEDLPLITFTEYSVTNKSNPTHEEDWLPILPVDSQDTIKEYLLVDDTGKALLRFPANTQESLFLYKNGMKLDIPMTDLLIYSNNNQSILGVQAPPGIVSSSDNLIVEYTPLAEANVVNFEQAGFATPPLVSSYDNNGPGESFLGTNGDLTLQLSYQPYIDYNQVDTSIYNAVGGLTPYQPIIISMSDGTVPINLTNYKDGTQATLDPNTEVYQYIHNKDLLLFNKAINQPLKVYYQYLPSSVRLRAILRSVTGSFVSPKVDWIQIKGKTRKADPKKV